MARAASGTLKKWLGPSAKSARLGIGAIVRDEGPYLLEWIAWHRCLGIKDFFIADNNSTDGTTELLYALDKAGVVSHFLFPGVPGHPPQLPAYQFIATTYGPSVDWIAFIDADEFIRPSSASTQANLSLGSWLASLAENVGGVGLNWAVFGSSGRATPGAGLVVERFPNRGVESFAENTHIKSIIRGRNWNGLLETPHGFAITPSSLYVDSAIVPLGAEEPNKGRTARATWGPFRLDHYAVKSHAEFIHKKVARGRPDTFQKEHARDAAYFALYDANTVSDPADPQFIQCVKAEMALIRAALPDLTDAQRDLDLHVSGIGADKLR